MIRDSSERAAKAVWSRMKGKRQRKGNGGVHPWGWPRWPHSPGCRLRSCVPGMSWWDMCAAGYGAGRRNGCSRRAKRTWSDSRCRRAWVRWWTCYVGFGWCGVGVGVGGDVIRWISCAASARRSPGGPGPYRVLRPVAWQDAQSLTNQSAWSRPPGGVLGAWSESETRLADQPLKPVLSAPVTESDCLHSWHPRVSSTI